MQKLGWLAVLGGLVLATAVGCGGNVKVDPPGEGGSGGSGGDGGGSPTTGTTGTPTGTNPEQFCADMCVKAQNAGCLIDSGLAECAQSCSDLFGMFPECTSEIYGLYVCAVDNIGPGCEVMGCMAEIDAYSECVVENSTCGVNGCSAGDNDCYCEGECDGSFLGATCKEDGNGSVFCSCSVNGDEVGTCFDMSLTCDLFDGCCSQFFF